MKHQNPGRSLQLQNSTSNPTQTAISQEQFRSEQAVVVQLRQRDAAQALVDVNLILKDNLQVIPS